MAPEIIYLLGQTPSTVNFFLVCYFAYKTITDVRPELLVTLAALLGTKARRHEARELLQILRSGDQGEPTEPHQGAPRRGRRRNRRQRAPTLQHH